jgi:hypothetical protein
MQENRQSPDRASYRGQIRRSSCSRRLRPPIRTFPITWTYRQERFRRLAHQRLMVPHLHRTDASAGKESSRHLKPTVVLRASVRRRRRAQGGCSMLRSITPKRANSPAFARIFASSAAGAIARAGRVSCDHGIGPTVSVGRRRPRCGRCRGCGRPSPRPGERPGSKRGLAGGDGCLGSLDVAAVGRAVQLGQGLNRRAPGGVRVAGGDPVVG